MPPINRQNKLPKDAIRTPPYVPKSPAQIASSQAVPPEIAIDTVTMAPISGSNGNNVRLAFHAIKSARGQAGANLPRTINVIVGKQKLEAVDVTGAGTYVADLQIPNNRLPSRPVVRAMRRSGSSGGGKGTSRWGCETVKCWVGCKGILFGGPCRVCLKCHFGD